jgi:hypothetical protein
MKRGTIRHPKLLHVAQLLALEPYAALGLLESLLDWAFDYARRGDVGRFDNTAIAQGIGWQGDPERLIAALVTARWFDPCAVHRLVIHGLRAHAPDSWRKCMQNQHVEFVTPQQPPSPFSGKSADLSGKSADLSAPPAPAPAPSLSFASLTQGAPAPQVTELGFERFWATYPKKRHKPAATRAWKAMDGARHLESIVAGIERWKRTEAWRQGFVEDPATFLRQRQWEDAVPEDAAAAQRAKIEARLAEAHRQLEEGTL